MSRFLLSRIASAIPTLLIVTIAVFVMIRLIPGDPASVMLGDLARPDQVEALRRQMGFDKPVVVQYFVWLSNVLTGEFGRSITTAQDVWPLLVERFLVSASIVLVAVAIAVAIAVPAGMFAAWRQNSLTDFGVVALSTLLLSIPSFWLGLMMLLVFGLWLDWFRDAGIDARSVLRGDRFEHFDMVINAAVSGLGAALVPEVLAEAEIAAGRLVTASERRLVVGAPYSLIYPARSAEIDGFAAFRDWLAGFRQEDGDRNGKAGD
mgnify:CR=1 FL=1